MRADREEALASGRRQPERSDASATNGRTRPRVGRVLFPRPASDDGPPAVKADPLPEQIADHLGHRVLRGEFPAGSRLKEIELAAYYRVSRGPIREALRLLERRGLAEVVPRHGARVRQFDIGEIDAVFSIRAVLLGLAARQAVEHGAPDLVPRLEGYVRALNQSAKDMAIRPVQHAILSGDAQRAMAARCGNPALAALLEDLAGRAFWRMVWHEAPLDFTDRKRRQQSARFWTALLAAIRAADAAAAEAAARGLIEASRDHTIAAMRRVAEAQARGVMATGLRPLSQRRSARLAANGGAVR